MKPLIRFLITFLCSNYLTNRLTEQFFTEGNWSYTIANIGFFVPVLLVTGAVLTWAFETKVADLHFQGKKIGTMKDEEQ